LLKSLSITNSRFLAMTLGNLRVFKIFQIFKEAVSSLPCRKLKTGPEIFRGNFMPFLPAEINVTLLQKC
jgi:hypothetical protein